jgi:integrase/recombinase XerD
MDGAEPFLVDRPAPRALRREQIQLLLKGQRRTPTGLRNRAMLAFMYDTGIRVSELTRLRLQDVDLATGLARIEGKTRSVDVVPLSRALCKELEHYLREHRPAVRPGMDAFFVSRGSEPISTNAIRLWLRRTKFRVGLEGTSVSPQVIRSTSATHLAAMGASAFEIQRFLRHTTVRMSQRYVNLAALDMARESPLQSLTRRPVGRGRRPSAFRAGWSRFGVTIAGSRSGDIAQLRSFAGP